MLGIDLGAAGCQASMLPLCYAATQPSRKFSLWLRLIWNWRKQLQGAKNRDRQDFALIQLFEMSAANIFWTKNLFWRFRRLDWLVLPLTINNKLFAWCIRQNICTDGNGLALKDCVASTHSPVTPSWRKRTPAGHDHAEKFQSVCCYIIVVRVVVVVVVVIVAVAVVVVYFENAFQVEASMKSSKANTIFCLIMR